MVGACGRRFSVAATVLALSAGCGEADPAPGGVVPPAASCVPHLATNWAPRWKPPVQRRPDACTAAQIDLEYASCEGASASKTRCSTFRDDPANAVCESCLFSDGSAAAYGPIILANGLWKSNTPGCIALL